MKIRRSRSEISLLIASLKKRGYQQVLYSSQNNNVQVILEKLIGSYRKRIIIKMMSNGWTEVI